MAMLGFLDTNHSNLNSNHLVILKEAFKLQAKKSNLKFKLWIKIKIYLTMTNEVFISVAGKSFIIKY